MTDLQRLNDALTSHRWQFKVTAPHFNPVPLRDYLTKNLESIDPDSWDARFAWGGLFVNGLAPTALSVMLNAPFKIDYFEPKYDFTRPHEVFPPFTKQHLIYEDADCLVAYKPPHLASLPPRERKHFHLKGYLEEYLGAPVHMPSRLDSATQGIVAVSKSSRMHRELQHAFERHLVKKTYLFETAVDPGWEEKRVTLALEKDERHPILRRAVSGDSTWAAQTMLRLIRKRESEDGPRWLISAQPSTGRTHQIRVHAATVGVPIVGDNFYGGARAHELHLLSYQVEFRHRFLDADLCIKAPDTLRPAWSRETF